jgi:hypothetical protein
MSCKLDVAWLALGELWTCFYFFCIHSNLFFLGRTSFLVTLSLRLTGVATRAFMFEYHLGLLSLKQI